MKTILVAVSLFSVLQGPYYPPPVPQATACSNGVIIRNDGAVMIDEWRFYDNSPGAVNPDKRYPSSVTLGKSIKGPVNLCVEFDNGTLCGDIGKLRALIEANFKPATATQKK